MTDSKYSIKQESCDLIMETFDSLTNKVPEIIDNIKDKIDELSDFIDSHENYLRIDRLQIEGAAQAYIFEDEISCLYHIRDLIEPQLDIKNELPDHDHMEFLYDLSKTFISLLKNLDDNPDLKKIFTNFIEKEKKDYQLEKDKEEKTNETV